MDLSQHLGELFLGNKRARALPTLIIALFVTALVAVPLTVRAVDARGSDRPPALAAAQAEAIMVDTADSERQPLDRQTISGNALISYRDQDAAGVAFNLLAKGGTTPVLNSADTDGPQFDLIPGDDGKALPFDTTVLPNGPYELFMSVSSPDGEKRTAVVFEVAN